jgi:hypothetical protein
MIDRTVWTSLNNRAIGLQVFFSGRANESDGVEGSMGSKKLHVSKNLVYSFYLDTSRLIIASTQRLRLSLYIM